MRTDTLLRLAREIYENYLGSFYVIRVFEKLLNKLGTALANTHSAERTVTGVRVRTEYHFAAACQLLASVGMYNALVCGNIYAAVFFSRGKTEHMVILIYSSADSAK